MTSVCFECKIELIAVISAQMKSDGPTEHTLSAARIRISIISVAVSSAFDFSVLNFHKNIITFSNLLGALE